MAEQISEVLSYNGDIIRITGRVDTVGQLPITGQFNQMYLVGAVDAQEWQKYLWDVSTQTWVFKGVSKLMVWSDKADAAALNAHKDATPADHPLASITDALIGNRTILNPATDSGNTTNMLTALLNALTTAIRSLRTSVATAIAQTHAHSNKSVLDQTSEAFTGELKQQYDSTALWVAQEGASKPWVLEKIEEIPPPSGLIYGEHEIVAPLFASQDPISGAMHLDSTGPFMVCQTIEGMIYFRGVVSSQ